MKRAFAALFSLFAIASLARAADDAVNQIPIELPKFVVTDTRELPPPEAWRYTTIPGFEVLTNASDRATQRLLRDFEMFRQALGFVWPMPNRTPQLTPLIICGRGAKFDAFVPAGKADLETARASLFLKDRERSAIVIDFEATTLNILNSDDSADAATGTDSGVISVEHDKQLYREYVHFILSRAEPRLPAWFEEGLAQIIMKMQFDNRWIEFARLEDPNTISVQAAQVLDLNAAAAAAGEDTDGVSLAGAPAEDRDFAAALRRKALVPMDRFFSIEHDAPEALNPLGNNRWAKQAYAFVHMCLYGYHGKYQKPFATFITRAAKEPVTEAMFKECFKMSYKDMLMEIRSYCDFTVAEYKEFRAKKGGPDLITAPPPLVFRDATQSEVGRIKGSVLLMGGHKDAARTALIAPYIRGERDPNLIAALGLVEHIDGKDDRARKFLEAACAAKAAQPEAYLELAKMRSADVLAKPAGADGQLSAAQAASVTDLLMTGRRQPPSLPEIYELMADTWVRTATPPKHEGIVALVDGVRLFPGRLKLVYETAALAATANELPVAHSLAEYGMKVAPDAKAKGRFEKLKASLPPEPPAPANPTAVPNAAPAVPAAPNAAPAATAAPAGR